MKTQTLTQNETTKQNKTKKLKGFKQMLQDYSSQVEHHNNDSPYTNGNLKAVYFAIDLINISLGFGTFYKQTFIDQLEDMKKYQEKLLLSAFNNHEIKRELEGYIKGIEMVIRFANLLYND